MYINFRPDICFSITGLNFTIMKRTVLMILVFVIATSARGQFLMLGVKGGVCSSTIQIDEAFDLAEGGKIIYYSGDATLGWHIGLFTRVSLGGLYIQPEALFSATGGEIQITEEGSIITPDIASISLNKLDVPVLLGYKFGNTFRMYGGPVISLLQSEKTYINNKRVQGLMPDFSKGTIGYQAGLGLDISRLLIDLKYENNLHALGESLTDPFTGTTFNTDTRNSQIILSLGLRF